VATAELTVHSHGQGFWCAIRHVLNEGGEQHAPRLLRRDAPRLQVEHLVWIQRCNGRAVAALDVIGVDLEFGLVEDLGAVLEQQATRHLVTVGTLGGFVDNNAPLDHATPLATGDALGQQAAFGVGGCMAQLYRQVDVPVGMGCIGT
jgi:hypothetical protein